MGRPGTKAAGCQWALVVVKPSTTRCRTKVVSSRTLAAHFEQDSMIAALGAAMAAKATLRRHRLGPPKGALCVGV